MKIPFRLRRRSAVQTASALLLTSLDVGELLDLCARLDCNPLPPIYAVAGGFLLKLREPVTASFPRTIRLRALADNLFLPVNAELVPALLDDEMEGLVRRRGLIFLPGGRVLSFSVDEPLPLSALMTAGPLRRRSWQTLPILPQHAERIRLISLDLPADNDPEVILDAGGEDIGSEQPRPPDASAGSRALGKTSLGLGRGLMWLGKLLGLKALARWGANLIAGALTRAPRLSEDVLGKQEAALRELLREFREGDRERALRRALPLVGNEDRGSAVSTGWDLPSQNIFYSLANILGTGAGALARWFGGADVQAELAQEYRKAAEEAERKGDARRAAYIYAKLLRDYRTAADALMRSGLYHDAGIIYLTKVGDTLAAARAFAAGGEIERAVQLYRQCGEHVAAAELLWDAGEEEAALAEFRTAADKLVASAGGHLAAGDLLLKRALRADLAIAYYEAGWALRPGANALPCAQRLASLYAADEKPERLLRLLDEADVFFEQAGNETDAGQWYHEVLQLAERDHLAELREDLRDRARLGIAVKLRQHAATQTRPGTIISTLLGQSSGWEPAVVSDAAFALKTALNLPRSAPPREAELLVERIKVGKGTVTAVCHAPHSGEIFVGFDHRDIVCFRPSSGEVMTIRGEGATTISLATDETARWLVVLRWLVSGGQELATYSQTPAGPYQQSCRSGVDYPQESWLAPSVVPVPGGELCGFWNGQEFRCLALRTLAPWLELPLLSPGLKPTMALLFHPFGFSSRSSLDVGLLEGCTLWYSFEGSSEYTPRSVGWTLGLPEGRSLYSAPLSWLQLDPPVHLELAGLDDQGCLHWSRIDCSDPSSSVQRNVSVRAEGYLAAAIVRSGLVVGVSRSHVDWLRCGAKSFTTLATDRVPLPPAVACFPSHATNEVIVVCREGTLARVTVPKSV
jgi:hypothetical protein